MLKRCVIVGGGISGLAVAHRLLELGRERGVALDITVLEASPRFGGVIETRTQDGWLLEGGPDAFISEKPWALALCRRLGLADQLLDTQAAHRRSFIVRHGRLVQVPAGLYLIAPTRWSTLLTMGLVSWPAKLRMACEPFIPARRSMDDESVGSFIRRRFGREALARIGQPMISGIYTADPEALSLAATMPRFQEMERAHGSVVAALAAGASSANGAVRQASGPRYSLFVTLRGGLGTLIETLIRRMPEAQLRPSTSVARIASGAAWTIILDSGERLTADALCVALPADRAARLLDSCAPNVARELAAIPYESVATVNLAFRRQDVPRPLDGFGVVIPAVEHRRMVGCTFSSVKFTGRAPEASVLLRAFVGGALHRDVMALDDAALERMVREEIASLFGIRATPSLVWISRHPQAMPQYQVGHLARVAAIEQALARHPGLQLAGNGLRGIGIPDCVHQAELAAQRMVDALAAAGTRAGT